MNQNGGPISHRPRKQEVCLCFVLRWKLGNLLFIIRHPSKLFTVRFHVKIVHVSVHFLGTVNNRKLYKFIFLFFSPRALRFAQGTWKSFRSEMS